MKKISICIPVLNEEENILNTYEKIKNIFTDNIKDYDYELIFTDNHSSDSSEKILLDLCKRDKKIKYIRFKNNLDYDKSILEAYKHSTGDAAIVIDCDLQDPPDLFLNFIKKWEEGHDVVYGVVKSRKENSFINLLRKTFYLIMNLNADIKYPLNAHDFRLVDKKIINGLKDNSNLFPYVRGITFALATNPTGVEYDRENRKKGKSKLGLYNTFTYAINALLEETFFFTKIFRRISLLLIFFGFLFSVINLFQGFQILEIYKNIIFLLIISIIMFLAIICEYVNRIYFQLKKTERIIYEKKINF
jgi:glycosyltransferase involved in cell wall biosynthesis